MPSPRLYYRRAGILSRHKTLTFVNPQAPHVNDLDPTPNTKLQIQNPCHRPPTSKTSSFSFNGTLHCIFSANGLCTVEPLSVSLSTTLIKTEGDYMKIGVFVPWLFLSVGATVAGYWQNKWQPKIKGDIRQDPQICLWKRLSPLWKQESETHRQIYILDFFLCLGAVKKWITEWKDSVPTLLL